MVIKKEVFPISYKNHDKFEKIQPPNLDELLPENSK